MHRTDHITLHRAGSSDAGELSTFAARSFRQTYDALMKREDLEAYLAEAFSPAVQAADLADPATIVILARDQGSSDCPMVGYVQIVAHQAFVELKRLYVDPPQQGRGLAALLVEEASHECRRLGSRTLRLTVWTQNTRAIAFYRKAGFDVTGSETFMVGENAQIDHVMEMSVLPAPA